MKKCDLLIIAFLGDFGTKKHHLLGRGALHTWQALMISVALNKLYYSF